MPELEGGGQFDGAHDVVIVAFRHLRAAGTGDLLALAGAAVLVAGVPIVAAVTFRRRVAGAARYVLTDSLAFALAAATALLATAVVLDLIPDRYAIAHDFEETLEFAAGGILLWFAVRIAFGVRFGVDRLPSPPISALRRSPMVKGLGE